MPTISQLPAATQVNSTDVFPIVQAGTTKQAQINLILTFMNGNIMITEAQVENLTTDLASKLAKAANLSDVVSAATSRINLGLPALSNGQVWIGNSGTPNAANITAGTNITITNTAGNITIAATGAASFSWTHVTNTTQVMSPNNGYVADNGSLVTLTLPATSSFGDQLIIVGKGAGGWTIAQNAGQNIQFGNQTTTTGAGGSLSSTNQYDAIELLCIVANTTWIVRGGPQGNIAFV